MNNSINFKGAVLLRQPTPRIQHMIKPALGKHYQSFENYLKEGDFLYVFRSSKDADVAEFLTHHNTKFEYYPDLSTKSGFDDEKQWEARRILKDHRSKILTTKNELKEHFGLRTKIQLPFSLKHKHNPLEASLKAPNIDLKSSTVTKKDGYSDIFNSKGELLARVSEPGQYGISFAFKFVEPEDRALVELNEKVTQRFAIRGGQVIFQYTNESGRSQFLKNYTKAVNANKSREK